MNILFYPIIVPLATGALLLIVPKGLRELIAIIGTFKAFATLWVFREPLALGTGNTFSVAIFLEFFEKLRYGYASAMAFVLFAIILGLTIINNKVQGSRVFFL